MVSDATNAVRNANSSSDAAIPLSLKRLVHRKLAEQRGRHRIGAVALLRPGQKRALDLCGAQGDIADDPPRPHFADDVHPRNAAALIGPGMPAEPRVQQLPAAVELTSVVPLGQWARRSDGRDKLAFPGRLTVGELHQRGQFLGRSSDPGRKRRPVLCRNDNRPVQHLDFGDSNALRRTNSLRLVWDCSAAASSTARSAALT